MKRFSDFIVQKRWFVLAVWLVAAALIVSLSPPLSSVESTNENNFIPSKYESIKALDVAKQMSPYAQDGSDSIVFKKADGAPLKTADIQTISRIVSALTAKHLSNVALITSSSQQLATNGKVQLATIIYAGGPNATATINTVKTVRDNVKQQLVGTDLAANVTGQESSAYDISASTNRALKIVSIVTVLLVLILPALIFRSPFAGLLPVLSVGVVDIIATALIADAGKLFGFRINQQLGIIFTVVLFGIGTDYILFLLFRYRERLRSGDYTSRAVSFALSRAGLAILSAALVVLSSFSALFFASFGIFSSLAPALAICVIVMMLAALTLVPALVAIIGPKIFWPSKAWRGKSLTPSVYKIIGGWVARWPAAMASLVILVLLVLGAFVVGYKTDFSSFSKPPVGTESAAGYNDLLTAFPPGETNPAQVYVSGKTILTPKLLKPLEQKLLKTEGIAAVLPPVISPSGKIALVDAILKNNPYSNTAITEMAGPIRTAAHSVNIGGDKVYVGGTTAIYADIEAVTTRDLRVLFPIAAVFIFIILAVLLRSLVAPVFLLFGVGLAYLATLGTTTLIFLRINGDAGLIFFIPLLMYIFVVAIGTDYNILTITRLKEEVREGHHPREAADLTIEHSSSTVASAGIILAATFGSLLLAGIGFLNQMGSAIAIGVLLSAFVIAPLLIPSLSAILGYSIWWPGHRPADHSKSSSDANSSTN